LSPSEWPQSWQVVDQLQRYGCLCALICIKLLLLLLLLLLHVCWRAEAML
jgi:hypothetical protein